MGAEMSNNFAKTENSSKCEPKVREQLQGTSASSFPGTYRLFPWYCLLIYSNTMVRGYRSCSDVPYGLFTGP